MPKELCDVADLHWQKLGEYCVRMDDKCTRPVRNKPTFSLEVLTRNSGFIVLSN